MLDEQDSDLAERIRDVFRKRGHDPTSDVPLGEIGARERWGGVLDGTKTDGFRDAYWNPEAGWCEADKATAALMHEAVKRGVEYVCGEVAELVLDHDRLAGVKTKQGELLTADQIVLATGAWTSALTTALEDRLAVADSDRVEKQVTAAGVCVAHYKMSEQQMQELTHMPVVVYGSNGEAIPPPGDCQLLKFTNAHTFTNTVTTSSGHKISVPPSRDQRVVSKKLRQETNEKMMRRVMPRFTAGMQPEYWRLCWDAYTPSQDWLLSRHPHPRLQNLYFAVGGSFHSYKFLPTVGEYMVKVLGGEGNGAGMDKAWGWKSGRAGRGAHEKTAPDRELSDLDDDVAKL